MLYTQVSIESISICVWFLWISVNASWNFVPYRSRSKLEKHASHVEFGNDYHYPSKNGFLLWEWIYSTQTIEQG